MNQSVHPPMESDAQIESTIDEVSDDAVFAKITRRLIPFLFLCYIMANIDRANIGIAQLQMKIDLGFSDAVYGLGTGVFFLSYFLFEVPSNLVMVRYGARRTLAAIMVCWGVVSSFTMLVGNPATFYLLRFLLGAFEAGFYPGVIFYLMRWYPPARRVRAIGMFSSALALANVAGGVLSGWILGGMGGVMGLKGWQWLFPLEGVPCIVLGLLLLVWFDERAQDARWLTSGEKAVFSQVMKAHEGVANSHSSHAFKVALTNPRLYFLSIIYFAIICSIVILTFWIPTMIHGWGIRDLALVSTLSAIPSVFSALGMVLVSARAQHTGEYRRYLAAGMLVGAAALALLPLVGQSFFGSMLLLCIGASAIFSAMPVFWSVASNCFSGNAAAVSIALISSLGLVGGFLGPTATGWLKTNTGSFDTSLYVHAALLAIGGFVVVATVRRN